MKKISLTLFIVLFSICQIMAQLGNIRGFVYDEKSGEPVIFTNVILEGTTMGAATDVNGFYSITKVPDGAYTVFVTALGFDTLRSNVTITNGGIVTKKLFVKKGNVQLKTFTVSAGRVEAKTHVKVSVEKVTAKEIKSLPSIGGEPDLAQYLQVLPGVVFTGDQGGQLYIRGGSPVQNKMLLDGMIVYNPFHSIGLFSVFDTDLLRNADVYTGGFGAEYGGRVSSIMDVTTKDGNKKRFGGKLGLSSFGGKLLLEGPLSKAKDNESGSSSFIFSAKHSYLAQSSNLYKPYFSGLPTDNARGIDTTGLPYNYTDLYGKISLSGGNGNKVNFFGFNFRDEVNFVGVSNLDWNATGVGSNFVLVPSSSKTLIKGVMAYSSYLINSQEGADDTRRSSSKISGFNAGMNFTTFSGDNEAKYGFELLGFRTGYDFNNSVGQKIEQAENTTEMAAFLSYRINLKKLVLEPGFRGHYYASLSHFSFEPRLGLKYNITENWRFKAAAGMYSQNLISASSDRDIVNLFYGFLSGPQNLQDNFVDEEGEENPINHSLQKANHLIVGTEYDISNKLGINIEGYFKDFKQLTNINRNKIFQDNSDNAAKADLLKKDFIVETGLAYGVDFVLKYSDARWNISGVYSLGKVTRWDGVQTYAPVFDRRHNVNLTGTYVFGSDRSWEASVRWNIGSGFPFTPTQGFYEQIQIDDINQDYTTANGNVGIIYGDLGSKRLPYYHRMDANIKRTMVLSENLNLEVNFSLTNMYNRQNIFYLNRVTNEKVYQLPLLPSLGASLTF